MSKGFTMRAPLPQGRGTIRPGAQISATARNGIRARPAEGRAGLRIRRTAPIG